MAPVPPPALYKKHFIDKSDERVGLYRELAVCHGVKNALYPGSFVQISPSFVIPRVVYVDNDRRTPAFFADPQTRRYIEARKEYAENAEVVFHHQSYELELDEPLQSFDLLISQYAGFISQPCKKYLQTGGLLIVNDSHGDASMANLDPDFELVAAVTRRGEEFRVRTDALDEYFKPKRDIELAPELLRESGRGVGYKQVASGYLFRKIG